MEEILNLLKDGDKVTLIAEKYVLSLTLDKVDFIGDDLKIEGTVDSGYARPGYKDTSDSSF